eukprot:scaffold703_cov168-Amphora_coffeaeformis.AAC.31
MEGPQSCVDVSDESATGTVGGNTTREKVLLALDVFLFFASWGVGFLSFGFGTVVASFLLCLHATCVLLIINNNRISALSFLAPTEFMVGNALGMTIGSTILSYFLHSVFSGSMASLCHEATKTDIEGSLCAQRKGSLGGVWFWSGVCCFLNFITALLIAYGRHELAPSTAMYEQVQNMTMEQYEQQIRNEVGVGAGPRPAFVGDYASVPEIQGNGPRINAV